MNPDPEHCCKCILSRGHRYGIKKAKIGKAYVEGTEKINLGRRKLKKMV
jgi:hypothetical protein